MLLTVSTSTAGTITINIEAGSAARASDAIALSQVRSVWVQEGHAKNG